VNYMDGLLPELKPIQRSAEFTEILGKSRPAGAKEFEAVNVALIETYCRSGEQYRGSHRGGLGKGMVKKKNLNGRNGCQGRPLI